LLECWIGGGTGSILYFVILWRYSHSGADYLSLLTISSSSDGFGYGNGPNRSKFGKHHFAFLDSSFELNKFPSDGSLLLDCHYFHMLFDPSS